jgi:hypothetical protein
MHRNDAVSWGPSGAAGMLDVAMPTSYILMTVVTI